MSLEKDAIKTLLAAGYETHHGVQVELEKTTQVAVPEGYSLVDIEPYLPNRSRFRGTLKTSSIADFVAYTKARHAEALKPAGFIDADKMSATVLFNLGDAENPGHGDHTAVLQLKPTAAYAAMIAANGKRFGQRELVDWLCDWFPNAEPFKGITDQPDTFEVMPRSAALDAIRQVTITAKSETDSRVGDFAASASTFDEIEAKSRIGLPSGFLFRTPPYLGLEERTYTLRLSLLTGDPKSPPQLSLRVIQLETHQEATAQAFKDRLLKDLEGVAGLTVGTFAL